MRTAAVIIDSWKLPVFERHLKRAGYVFGQTGGVTPDTLVLRVAYEDVKKLRPVIADAQVECALAQAQAKAAKGSLQ